MKFADKIQVNPSVSLTKGKAYPFIEMANVNVNARDPLQVESKIYSSGVKFEKGDTVIARIEPCLQNRKGFYVNELSCGFGSTEFLVFRPKDESIDDRFLYYYLQTDYIRKSMIASMTGATGRQRVNNDIFIGLEIDIPSIQTQRRIADVLNSYDDLIENNQKRIKLLEEAAMRLYKEWFVYLRFPGYESAKSTDGLPEGWIPCVLHDVVEFNPTVIFDKKKKKKSVPMAALNTNLMTVNLNLISETNSNAGSKFRNFDTLLARITPCLENGKTAFVDFLEENEIAIGSTEYIVMRAKRINPYMVYCLARTDNFRKIAISSMRGADGRQRVNKDRLENMEYLLPTEYIVEACSNFMKPLFSKVSILQNQCHQLRQARDKLLPKLMSGEIEV